MSAMVDFSKAVHDQFSSPVLFALTSATDPTTHELTVDFLAPLHKSSKMGQPHSKKFPMDPLLLSLNLQRTKIA